MRNLTTKEVIKIVPLGKDLQNKLLAEFDSYDEALKFDIARICWEAFHDLKEQLTELKRQQFLEDVSQGQRQLGTTLSDDVQEAVEKDLEEILAGKREEQQELNAIRTQLESLINKHTQ